MDDVLKGFVAGFAGTIVLSIMMIVKAQMGVAPGFDVIAILAQVVEAPGQPFYGWLAHFAVGIFLWGGLFALASDVIPGPYAIKGIAFGIAGWLLMMLVFLPIAGHPVFGTDLGTMVPVMSLVLHVIFGLVLGLVYRSMGGTAYTVEKLT